ncbi:ATP-binding protein [Coxiella burnetii]|uniref:Hypothetical ATPase n=1 Tax=Coxiella burnetii (strain Dugway 5J108-111) TaxID=434922 RepID=A9KF95_COXBN|nr:ATP-binding protein [Coxiella burnetii]ABS77543.1 hypothetical ATPase [Coxiella burnetii Dugway 5J108-111]ACJ20868.1 hypothetical ATPase [Coxiella burnetii CbuK_Q154]AIT63954.1 putative ATPase [Coxiella burnetii str. Namibia]ATN86448.1 ATPase [Coxiella burnetii str. Schperling]EAX32432.1 ATPase [Coxiella burnetii 'MSU Goat Q177']
MKISKSELIAILSQLNPWWKGERAVPNLPLWRRAVFHQLFAWVANPPAPRAVLLSGARQVGKTTLLLQSIEELLKRGMPPGNILYATFDHPIIKLAGMDAVLEAWQERVSQSKGTEYLFLDEAQFIQDWGAWVKHQVDFNKNRRITFTGSAMPLIRENQESGVGRWHTIRLTTLSFYEYIQLESYKEIKFFKDFFEQAYGGSQFGFRNIELKDDLLTGKLFKNLFQNVDLETLKNKLKNTAQLKEYDQPKLPELKSLRDLFNWPQQEFYKASELAAPYVARFHQYLLRGGFPQVAQIDNINQAQRLLREDIVDKVLKRDMTALFGVRRILDLEQVFLYLCLHDGGILKMEELCENLGVTRPTAQNFIELLEAVHLIYRLPPFGYGKNVLRGKFKIYIADPAIAPAVLLKGDSLLDDSEVLGRATEAAVFKHLFTRYYPQNIHFSYWHGKEKHEVDLVGEVNNEVIPFEVKYRSTSTNIRQLKGLLELCQKKSISRAYVITKSLDDFGLLNSTKLSHVRIMRIPAPLFCYWMGEMELSQTRSPD